MNFESTTAIQVFFVRGSEKLSMGRLALKDRKIFFEYTHEFIKAGLELSPFKLPLKPGIFTCKDYIFDGLFGIFNDSLPDGWGKLLLDRKLMGLGINTKSLSALDRLRYVGKSGMGALIYEPEFENIHTPSLKELDEIAEEVYQFQENENDQFVDDLLVMNGSSAGARPKIILQRGEEEWLIKFRSSLDPKDIGPIEYAYHLMAKAANLDVPEAKLFPSKKGLGFFGVKRFDRNKSNRCHMHTVSGLLHADYRIPSLDYETLMKATAWLTKDSRECEKQFKAAVFNVLTHNRDDHSKNFSFLMNEKGEWRVSPAYDLTFSSGPSGEHSTTIMKEGKNPTLSHLLKLAEVVGINNQKTKQIVEEIKSAVSGWERYAKEAGVNNHSMQMIKNAFERIYVVGKF